MIFFGKSVVFGVNCNVSVVNYFSHVFTNIAVLLINGACAANCGGRALKAGNCVLINLVVLW